MTTIQTLELLSKIQTALHNAQDEIDDIQDNEAIKLQAMKYLLEAESSLYNVIDHLDNLAIIEGGRSGAV